jgi:hypothetical protein
VQDARKGADVKSLTVENDITIIGGGLAGTCAAIAAARLGSTVTLINNRPVLGGNSSSEIRVWVCGATAHGGQKFARETGIMGELFVENQYRNPEGNPNYWDQVVLDAVRAEPNIELWLNTDIREVEAEGPDDARRIISVTGWQMGSEKLVRFEGPLFVDATGDGYIGFRAGADFRLGREAHDELGEEWAPEAADSHLLGSTILLYTKDAGRPERFVPPSIAVKIDQTPIPEHRNIRIDANGCDYWWIEYGGELDIVHDNETIRDELWGVVYGIWDYIKNSGKFEADNLTLEWVGSIPGKREYRRFLGDHVLTQQEVMEQVKFDDAIGFGGWSIDLHAPGGVYHAGAPAKNLFPAGVYHIPFGSLYSRNVTNMMMAGRDISASHVAFGTIRVMATCAIVGEATGTGAALAVQNGLAPRELATTRMGLVQQTLLKQDASVLGVAWTDPGDKVLSATVTASSSLRSLGVEDAEGTPFSIGGEDFALLLPADPAIGGLELEVEALGATTLHAELWETGGGENHIPVDKVAEVDVAVDSAGRRWLPIPLEHAPRTPRNVVLVLRRNEELSVLVTDRPGPYGVMGMVARIPRVERTDGGPQTNKWDAAPLRRHGIRLRVATPTDAYSPDKVAGGYQRPYDGPQLWSSEALREGRPEHVELAWTAPQRIERVDLIFNDDVDEDLINLHHHRTAFEVIPELVRDYRVEAEVDGRWQELVAVEGNRRRHRVHTLETPVPLTGLRVVVESTNGSQWASIVAVRAF